MKCIDCEKEISKSSTRCKSCSNKNRTGTYKFSPQAIINMKKKRPHTRKNKCIDCNGGITKRAMRCEVCAGIHNSGENNYAWKGDNITKGKKHVRITKNKPKPDVCEECKSAPAYELSNKDHKYSLNVDDYRWLCRHCHMKYDYKMGFRVPHGKEISRDANGKFVGGKTNGKG